jgi:Zn-dependent protease
MVSSSAWPVPFILAPQTWEIDAIVTFCVSVLLATMVNAEAQAFAATFLGDARKDAKDRFNFNVFLHLDILGTICYLVGGFGWPRRVSIDPTKFKRPRADTVITRSAGPLANLLLSGIGGSLALIISKFGYDPRVFLMVVGVNITTAVYCLIPLPPLPAGWLVHELLPEAQKSLKAVFLMAGPYAILALALLERLRGQGILSYYLDPIVRGIYQYLVGGF